MWITLSVTINNSVNKSYFEISLSKWNKEIYKWEIKNFKGILDMITINQMK